MKNFRSFLFLTAIAFSVPSFADEFGGVIDLKHEGSQLLGLSNKYLKTISTGEGISFSFQDSRPHYVERLLISAIGEQSNFSFVKVYADGDEVATLGVPGRDPEYPIVIRGDVSNITLRAQDNSRVKILDFKIFTERKEYSSYSSISRTQRSKFSLDQWGGKVLDIALELESLKRVDGKISSEDMKKFIVPLKKKAIKIEAASRARDSRSMNTKEKAKELVKSITSAQELFMSEVFLIDARYDMLNLDLETIKQDIGDKYDINVD